MCACSVNNADVNTSSISGGRGNAVDVIAWSTGIAGGRGKADIISSTGMASGRVTAIDVITSCVGTTGRRGNAVDVITLSAGTAKGRGTIDVITSSTGGGRVGAFASWHGNIDVTALADRENVCSGWRENADISASSLAGGSRNVGVRGGITDVIAVDCVLAGSGRKREKAATGRRESVSDSCRKYP